MKLSSTSHSEIGVHCSEVETRDVDHRNALDGVGCDELVALVDDALSVFSDADMIISRLHQCKLVKIMKGIVKFVDHVQNLKPNEVCFMPL